MKYITLLSILLTTPLCAANRSEVTMGDRYYDMLTLYHRNHTYLIYQDKFMVHDPECPCHSKWKAINQNTGEEFKIIREK